MIPPAASPDEAVEHLLTVRDWLRHGVSQFTAAGLVFGHGTMTALDEAAYLILHALHLPIDTIEPWLDARLLPSERERVLGLLDLRISTRKPAPYLTHEAWMHGLRFYVDERVIVPRSLIGDLLRDGLLAVVAHRQSVQSVLDLCTGSGCLAVLAAHAFPHARVDAADISTDALAVALRNIEDHGLGARIRLIESDLFDGFEGRRYDLILANPPYVTDATMATFPPEHQVEPRLAHAGGVDGLAVVRRIIAEAGRYLEPSGNLVVEVGAGRPLLEAEFAAYPFLWLDTDETEGEVFALPAAAFARGDSQPARKAKLAERVRGARSD